MKKDLFKKILKYIGVALIGAFVGIGALAGVSSCHNRSKNTANVPVLTKRGKQIKPGYNGNTFDINYGFDYDKIYYIVVKNYENQGKGYLWDGDSISIDNSSIMEIASSNLYNEYLYGDFDIIDNATLIRHTLMFVPYLNGGLTKLRYIALQPDYSDFSNTKYIYNTINSSFDRTSCAFTFTHFTTILPDQADWIQDFYYNLNQWFDVYDLSEYAQEYDFNTAFNFNNFYQVNNTFYAQPYSPVVGATTTNTNWVKSYNTGMFSSGGLVFDTIKVTFERNLDYYFETTPNSGEYLQFPTNVASAYNYYFLQMEYINSATNFSVTACNRTSYTKSGHSYIQFLPAWSNQGFKILHFESKVSSLYIQSIFNSLSDTEQLNEPIVTNNVGLSNAFSLLSLAFTAWLPIMNISIVPGITIGLLLFLPLVVGIIILVIWIVKR